MSFGHFAQKMAHSRSYRNLITGYEFLFPQTYFMHHKGQRLIDDVLRFEALPDNFEWLVRHWFPDVSSLLALRDHGSGDHAGRYDDASRALVRQIHADDFSEFGYSP